MAPELHQILLHRHSEQLCDRRLTFLSLLQLLMTSKDNGDPLNFSTGSLCVFRDYFTGFDVFADGATDG